MMLNLEVRVSEALAAKLRLNAARLGVSPEVLIVLSVEEKLARLDLEFNHATDYVSTKNAELYKRLAT